MTRRAPILLVALGVLFAPVFATAAAEPAPRQTALVAHVVLKVVHPDQVRQALTAEARKAGGYHTLITKQEVVLKIPPEHLTDFLRAVSKHGLVLEKTLERADLTAHIADLEGRLRSKRSIFAKLTGFFDGAKLEATLDIERNMRQLVEEMEAIKGELRVQHELARWAVVNVAFRFRERDRVRYARSPFGWLNAVDLDGLRDRFEQGD